MPFGARRFTQLVYDEEEQDGKRVGFYRARFVPLDFGAKDELLTEEQLTREIDDNLRATWPKADQEERLALAAFKAQARGKTFSRAAVASVVARGEQRVIVDPLDPPDRALIERWRHILSRAKLPPRGATSDGTPDPSSSSKHDFLDTSRDVLAFVDKYFPRAKGA